MSRKLLRLLALASIGLVAPTAALAASTSGALSATTTTTTTSTSSSTATTTTTTTTSSTTTTTSTTTTVKPKPKRGSLALFFPGIYAVAHQPVTIPGRSVEVDGVIHPYVAGQWVTVKAYLGPRLVKQSRLRIKPGRGFFYGRFATRLSSPGVGTVKVQVTHDKTSAQVGFTASRAFSALDTHVGFGSGGRFVQLIQQRLAALHFWIPQTGLYDNGTGLAIDAYHRLLRWGVSQSLDSKTITWLLNGWGEFKVRYGSHGHHAEGNLGLQLLALVDGSNVNYIFPISSGKPSTPTVLGNFHIYQRTPGYLPDGMYYSSFFIGGYAIHGYDPAPDYPASHGCMRLPIPDAIPAYNWLRMGDAVDVYY